MGPWPPLEVTYSLKKVPTFPGPSVQTPLVHEKPAVMTVSGCGVAEAGGVVEAWSVSVACGPVGVGVTCDPIGVDVGVVNELVGVGVRDRWLAETELGTRSPSSSKLVAMMAMSILFITTSSKA